MTDRLLVPTFFCPRPWETMRGDELTRFCEYCRKEVHNLNHPGSPARQALLKGDAARLCGRYQASIRRARPEHRESYTRHLLRCGVGVAAAGAVAVVLWEIAAESGHSRFVLGSGGDMSRDWYDQRETILMGAIRCDPLAEVEPVEEAAPNERPIEPVAPLVLPTADVDRLFGEEARAEVASFPLSRVSMDQSPTPESRTETDPRQ